MEGAAGRGGGSVWQAPALDSRTNKIVWQKRDNFGQSYGSVSTAGGLVFRGKVDGNLDAYDAKTGDVLWTFQTGL